MYRADIQSIFDPIYNQILKLVQDQMDAVQGTYREKLKVYPSQIFLH